MKALSILLLISISGCSQAYKPNRFDHELFTIEYPSDWVERDSEELILVISKYDNENALFKEENPSLTIFSQNLLNLTTFGIQSFDQYVVEAKKNFLQ